MNNDEDKSTTSQATPKKDTAHNETSHEDHSADRKAEAEESVKKQNENIDEQNIEKTWHNKNVLKRGIAMLGYGFVAGFVRLGITLIALFQFFSLLFAEKPNQPLVKFGQDLNTYLYQINQFLTINSETYPFPFADWPDSPPK
tara:strand:+ start:5482 stop:5910 length:429 start_codon:yes stop_codon:yes gene_type:complete